MKIKAFFLCLFLGLTLGANEVRSDRWEAEFITSDDVKIRGAYYQPQSSEKLVDADAVILVHMLGGDRKDWGDLPSKLSQAGFAVLNIQLRGHRSREDSKDHWTRFEKEETNAMVHDILGAKKWLLKQKKVHIKKIAVVGARLGANLALSALKLDDELKACYALSPGLNYRGVKLDSSLEGINARPIKCVASTDDKYAQKCLKEFESSGAKTMSLPSNTSPKDYGTELLDEHESLATDIIDFIRESL